MHVSELYSPLQLKGMSINELETLAGEIRLFLIRSLSQTGGHLSSNLGIVELTLAMHVVFNTPMDKIIFDVGHQAYVHKILTGRAGAFSTLRQYGGLCGFPKCAESKHDAWEPGHSSTSISAALGMAAARDIQGENFEVAAVIGDGALASGMSLEALNDLGAQQRKMIVIFNDNNMSISRNPGGLERSITKLRTSGLYRNTKRDLSRSLNESASGRKVLQVLEGGKNYLKHQMIDAPLFSQFDLDYIGPVDGHNIAECIQALQTAKEHRGPVVVHVLTQKGKGYPYAEADTSGDWHGVPPFDLKSGKFLKEKKPGMLSWSEIISNALCELAEKDKTITAITPAMANGSKLQKFARLYPDRFFDCGIAEEHAVTMAAGMAKGGLHPFVSIYSSFAQRAYDQISHDASRMRLPVVFGIDRAGLVGEDGETHQGIYDISFLRTIPNLIIAMPKNAEEARSLLYTAFSSGQPFALRYPRGNARNVISVMKEIPIGTWSETLPEGMEPELTLIAYGPDVQALEERIQKEKLPVRVINARFLKPLDHGMLKRIAVKKKPVVVFEPDTMPAGLGEAIAAELYESDCPLTVIGIPDQFVSHGKVDLLRKALHISIDDVMERVHQILAENKPAAVQESSKNIEDNKSQQER